MSSPCYGRIVWVEILDPQGRNPKCRPAVIVTRNDQITPDGEVRVVGITTQVQAGAADQVELQWDPRGNCRTKLRERSAAVCTWVLNVPVSAIQDYAGIVPGPQMIEINARIKAPPPGEPPSP